MFRRRKQLVVPVRDRRQRRRIVTLRNFRNVVIVLVVIYAGFTLAGEWLGSKPADYGRLLGTQLHGKPRTAATATVAVPVADTTVTSAEASRAIGERSAPLTANNLDDGSAPAPPSSAAAMTSGTAPNIAAATPPASPTAGTPAAPATPLARSGDRDHSRFVIVNDTNGVHVERSST